MNFYRFSCDNAVFSIGYSELYTSANFVRRKSGLTGKTLGLYYCITVAPAVPVRIYNLRYSYHVAGLGFVVEGSGNPQNT